MEIDTEKLKEHIASALKEMRGQRFMITDEVCIGTADRGKFQIHLVVTQDRDDFHLPVPKQHICISKV